MSINDIELPEFILAELYKDTLLYAPNRAAAPPASLQSMEPAPLPAAVKPPSPVSATSVPTAITSAPPMPGSLPQASTASVSASPPPAAVPSAPASPPPAAPAGYKSLGNNRRKITILVQSPGTAFLPDDQLTFLTKILEACQMNIGDVAIVNQAQAPVIISTLRQQLHPAFILLFGVDPITIRLPIQFPAFKIQEYDECTYLSAPPLAELVPSTHEGKLLKSKLWVCLKTMFNV